MNNTRLTRAKTNIIVSFICQIFTLICGIIVPRLYIRIYGSESYGAISSITQFLAYISLLEGGVAGVARAALYKPLSNNNYEMISAILGEIKLFFHKIGYIFIGYVLLLACVFKYISGVQSLNWLSSFLLVLAISISTFAQYFIGITYSVFLQANQQQYISNIINVLTLIVNTIVIVVLILCGFDIVSVRFISSCIFVLRPLLLWLYVKKYYPIKVQTNKNKEYLTQKWSALGQHIAYFLHSNTDVAVLTLFGDLKLVSVYSVYHMVTSAIQNLTVSCTAGMEAVFGDMIAKLENKSLEVTFGRYETMISIISNVLFGTTLVMIIPFVSLYTSDINDANYIVPFFSILLVFASYVFCLRLPYHSIIIAAGKFIETRIAAYGEAAVNIITSIVLVIRFGIIGVACGTVIAVIFRFLYYVVYLKSNVICRNAYLFIKRSLINLINYSVIYFVGIAIASLIDINSYFIWIVFSFFTFIESVVITLIFNFIFYNNDICFLINKFIIRFKKNEYF